MKKTTVGKLVVAGVATFLFFWFFGKLILTLAIVGGVGYGWYKLKKRKKYLPKKETPEQLHFGPVVPK